MIFINFAPRLPFNWKTPIGYLIALIFIDVAVFGAFLGIMATVALSASFSCLLISFAESIENDVNSLNAMSAKCGENIVQMKKLFKNIIEDLSDMKQLSKIRHKFAIVT